MSIGWIEFFTELESLLYEFSRRYSESNEVYCEYVVSRCAIAIRTISGVEFNAEQLLREDQDPEDQGELQVTLYNSTQLLSSLRTISLVWEERLQALSIQLSPHIPPIVLRRHVEYVGRPSFAISTEQVLFCWKCHFPGSKLPDC